MLCKESIFMFPQKKRKGKANQEKRKHTQKKAERKEIMP